MAWRVFLTLALLACLALLSQAMGQTSFSGAATQQGPAVDFNFAAGVYQQAGLNCTAIASCLTVSRASSETCADNSGNYTTVGNNTACITNAGLAVWESRTNSIRNNTMQGAVAGSPGTLPTNWVRGASAGLSSNVIGTGTTTSGIAYVDLELVGNATGSFTIQQEGNQQIVASQNQTWATSMFVALVGGSLTNLSAWSVGVSERDASGNQLSGGYNTGFTPNGTLTRILSSGTLSNASTAFVAPRIAVAASGAVDATIRIGWPQQELGSFSTPPILTTNAAVTRAADVITLTSPPIFQGNYSLAAFGTPAAPTTYVSNQFALTLDDNSSNNRAALSRNNGTGAAAALTTSGGVGSSITLTTWTQNTSGKIAQSVANGSQTGVFNGGTPGTTSGSLPVSVSNVRIGAQQASTNQFDGTISRALIWPTAALTTTQLQNITGSTWQ